MPRFRNVSRRLVQVAAPAAVLSLLVGGTAAATVPANAAPAYAHVPKIKPPGKPTIVKAIGVNQGIGVTWTAPATNGGSPIIGYTVTATPSGKTCTTNASTYGCAVTGLTNGAKYKVSV
ncbi:MAG: fibronectin type III domain-containing protein, partial [Acidimicrobiales bacterium]